MGWSFETGSNESISHKCITPYHLSSIQPQGLNSFQPKDFLSRSEI